MHKISTVRLAAIGCVYNAEEGYFECTGCAKVTMLNNGIIKRLIIFSTFIRKKMHDKHFMNQYKECKRTCNHMRLFDYSLYFPEKHLLLLAPQINTVYDIITYHQLSCCVASVYIEKQEKKIGEGMINLHELKRFHKHFHQSGWYISSYKLSFECRKTLKVVNVMYFVNDAIETFMRSSEITQNIIIEYQLRKC